MGKDIDVVIKARDKASKQIDDVSKAIKSYNAEQDELTKGAKKTSDALGGLAGDVSKFQREVDRLKSTGKIAAELDKASAAVTRMETAVRESSDEVQKLTKRSDEAAAAATKLKAALAAEEAALASSKASLKDNNAQLSAANKLVREAERDQVRYNKAIAATPETKLGSGARSAGVFIASDLAAAKATQAQVNAEVGKYEAVIKQSTAAVKELKPQVSEAGSLQRYLANETERATAALAEERDTTAKASVALEQMKASAAEASKALGTVGLTQEQVSAAAIRMAANLAAAKARIDALASASTTTAGPRTTSAGLPIDTKTIEGQRRAMLEARKEWVASQAAVKTLAQELKAADAPTAELGAEFGRAQARARQAADAYDAQRTALQRLGGSAKSTFLSFSQGATAMRAGASSMAAANSQIASSAAAASNSQRQLAPAVRGTAQAAGAAAGQTNSLGLSLSGLTKNARDTVSVFGNLRSHILSLTASYIGFNAAVGQVGGAITAYKTLEAAQSRLGAVFQQDTAKVAVEVGFLREQADRLGISFGTLSDEYGKFVVASSTANFTMGESRKIFLSVAEAARVNKLSTEQTSGVFLALTQMISKGKVSAEELRGQLGERLTGAFNIFASAIGVTTAKLDEMLRKGEVIADRSTLLKFADEMNKRFGSQLPAALDTATTDLGRFENSIFSAQLTIANGLVPGLRLALQSFDEFSKSMEGQTTFTNLGVLIGKFLQVLAQVPEYFDEITFAAKVFAAIKLGEIFIGIGARVVAASRQMGAFTRQVTLIGPMTQAAAQSQTFLARGLGQVSGALGTYRQNLMASTSQTALARVGVFGLANSIGILRTVLLSVGTLARGFLAAFGGIPGIIATGITFAVGSWLLSVDKATAALTEHERQLQATVTGYQNAKDKAGDWAKAVNGVTLAQAVQSTEELRAQFKGMLGDMAGVTRVLKYAFSDFGPETAQIKQLNLLTAALDDVEKRGAPAIKDLAKTLNEIALNPADEQFKEIALQLLDMVNNAKDGGTSLEALGQAVSVSEAKLRLYSGTATEADRVLLGLKDSVDEVTDTFDRSAAVKTYTDAIDDLKSKIPGLADELKKLKEITDINKTAWEGLVAAFKSGDVSAIAKIVGLWAQAGNAAQTAFERQRFDSLPDSGKGTVDRIIYLEGGKTPGSDTNKPGSSAQGIGQFTESTWLPIFNRLFPALTQLTDAQKLAYRYNEDYARPVLEELTKQNQSKLAGSGLSPDPGNTYLAHFLGSGDAIKVLLANPEELAKNIIQPASTAANPTVIKDNTTVQDLINWANQKMGGGSKIMAGGKTKQEDFDEGISQRVEGYREEANARKESNREGFIAKELQKAEVEATAAGTALRKEQIAAIREAAGAKYDSAHADEALNAKQEQAREVLNDIVGLDQQRKTLLEEMNMAQQAGDNSKVTELQGQLTGINGQLDQLIPKAMEFARALGDEKMVAQLEKVQLSTVKAGRQFTMFGLSFEQTKSVANSMADGLVGVFDTVTQSIASGEDALKTLGRAFLKFTADILREIATIQLRSMFLKTFESVLGIGGASGAIPTAHTGGLVGSTAIGGGNGTRQVTSQLFANAMRYHSGGIVGLKPDEMPAILKKNEEVLTEDDPNHRFNRGKDGDSSGGTSQPIKQVLVLDQRELANAMASSAGEKVIITHLRNNAETLRRVLGKG